LSFALSISLNLPLLAQKSIANHKNSEARTFVGAAFMAARTQRATNKGLPLQFKRKKDGHNARPYEYGYIED